MSIFVSQQKYKALIKELDRFKAGDEINRYIEKNEKLTKKAIKAESSNIKLKDEIRKLKTINENLKCDNKLIKEDYEEFKCESKNKDKQKDKEIKSLKEIIKNGIKDTKQILEKNNKLKTKSKEIKEKNKELKSDIEKIKAHNQKLKAQVNRDYTNSSLSSSQKIGCPIICNGREKSGKKPGAQKGHEGNGRKKYLNVDKVVKIPRPDEYTDENLYKETGNIIKKQVADIYIGSYITEYHFMEYKNVETGEIVHAKIPKALHNEVSYGENVKALAVMLGSDANVSIDKTIEIIKEISNQDIQLSKGFVNGLNNKIVKASEAELEETFINLQKFKYMHVDATGVRLNGKNVNVFVNANPYDTLFYARKNKGRKGVEDTAVYDYTQTLIHDHDKTFYNYGGNHQECLAHILRYLQSSVENETKLTWHKKMKTLLQEIISSSKKGELDDSSKSEFIKRYDSILELSSQEYEENPPTKYFREGFNLAKRLKKYKEATLYFLEDEDIPYTNNLAERKLRKIKRKSRVSGSFRSFNGLESYCGVQSVIENTKSAGKSIFSNLKRIFKQEISFNE